MAASTTCTNGGRTYVRSLSRRTVCVKTRQSVTVDDADWSARSCAATNWSGLSRRSCDDLLISSALRQHLDLTHMASAALSLSLCFCFSAMLKRVATLPCEM